MGDYRNRLRQFRENKGVSQRQLAATVGTSQQQIQRYETGSPVKLNMAVALAKGLDTTLDKLFPESRSSLKKLSSKVDPSQALSDPEIEKGLLEAGIQLDPYEWTARVVVRGGDPQQPRLYPFSVSDRNRVNHYLDWGYQGSVEAKQADEDAKFFLFDAGDRTVAVNMDHLIFWQSLWDRPGPAHPTSTAQRNKEDGDEGEEFSFSYSVNIFLAGIREPMSLQVEPDEEEPDDPECDEGDFRNLLITLDSSPEKDSFISFTDEDGEVAHFRVRDIAIIEIAKDVTGAEPLEEDQGDEVQSEGPTYRA